MIKTYKKKTQTKKKGGSAINVFEKYKREIPNMFNRTKLLSGNTFNSKKNKKDFRTYPQLKEFVEEDLKEFRLDSKIINEIVDLIQMHQIKQKP